MNSRLNILSLLIITVAAAAVYCIQDSAEYRGAIEENPEFDMFFLPQPEIVQALSLGFDEVAADIYWIRTILYFGQRSTEDDLDYIGYELREENLNDPAFLEWRRDASYRFRYLYDMLEIVTELDPLFHVPYTFGGLFLSMKLGRPDLSIRILEKGRKNVKDSWRIPYFLGFNYFFYKDEELKAAEYFMEAAEHPDAPVQVIRLAQGILVKAGKRQAAIDFLTGVRNRADSKTMRREMNDLIDRLQSPPAEQDTVRTGDMALSANIPHEEQSADVCSFNF